MPKLSKSRIINLNYNDGKRTIYNEIFDYENGNDTLFSMENGVGKTVLIQFFMQPFLKGKRDLAGRKFEDYFTNNAPTYIMHEILLENGEMLLAGMIIKKETKNEEDKNNLKILAFTNKYPKKDDFDIVNIPFIDGKIILKFSEAEKKIKDYARRKNYFKVYNINDNSKKNEYFNELDQHKINHKEWENIIKKINNDESGLSNLFEKCKTDEALIRAEIIPLIESKLNSETNQIENIKENLIKYIENYKGSKDAIERVKCFDEFINDSLPIKEKMEEGAKLQEKKDNISNELASTSNLLKSFIENKNNEKRDFENYIIELQQELKILNYEKLSYEYHYLDKDIQDLNNILEDIQKNIDSKEIEKKGYDKELNILKAAEIYEKINELNKKLASVEERLSNYEKNDNEIGKNIRNYRFTLNTLYDKEIKEKTILIETLKKDTKNIEIQREKLSNEKNINIEELIQINSNIKNAKEYIKNFQIKEQELKDKYEDFSMERNPLLEEYNKNELEKYKKNLEKIFKQNENEIIKLSDSIENIEENINISITKHGQYIEKNSEYIRKSDKIKSELEAFNQATIKIENILEIKHFERKPKEYKQICFSKIIEDIKNFEENREKLLKEKNEIENIILKYKTGLVNLPRDLEKEFNDKDIEFEYGLTWLEKYKGSFEEKSKIIDINPFLPYSLILNKKDYEILKSQGLDSFISIPIPIIDKNKLHEEKEIKVLNGILRIDNQDFILSFNKLLLDEEKRKKLILEQENKINILDKEIDNIKKAIETNQGYKATLISYSYNGDEGEKLNYELDMLEKDIKEIQLKLMDLKNLKEEYTKELIISKNKLKISQEQLKKLEIKRREFLDFLQSYEIYLTDKNKISDLNKALKIKNEEALEITIKIEKLDNDKVNKSIELRNIEDEKYTLERKQKELGAIKEGEFIKEDINSIEGKLKACLDKYDADIKRDLEDKNNYQNEIKNRENKLEKIIKNSNLNDEFCSIRYDEALENNLDEKLKDIDKEISKLRENHQNHRDKKLILEGEQNAKKKELNKEGYLEALALEEIKDINFKTRELKYKKDLKEYKEILSDYINKVQKLQNIYSKIEKFTELAWRKVELKLNFEDIPAFEKQTYDYITLYEEIKKIYEKLENEISKLFVNCYEKYRDRYNLLKDRLLDFTKEDSKVSAKGKFESLVEVIEKMRDTEKLNLENIKNEEDMVIKQILRYSKNVYDEMKKIDKKSSINIHGKMRKMLEIAIPEEIEEDGVKDFIKKTVEEVVNLEGNYKEIIDSEIQTPALLGKLIGSINRIKVFINKIEKNALVKKRWKEALSQNSGGEKFVSMFILLASLMSYMRRKESQIGTIEDSKIIIMDNPFAKTNAEHLLEPMFDIAEKYGIQLLCFSGIGGSSIYNRFNKIYVAKVITDRFRNNDKVEFITDTSKDSLEISHLQFAKEQMTLF